jgi:type IV pilus assembly protein PilA
VRTIFLTLLFACAGLQAVRAQNQTSPQTARQAILEILLDRTPAALEKHLPDAARSVVLRGGDLPQMSIVRELTSARRTMFASGGQMETFDTGMVLLAMEEKESQHKVEIIVERDDLAGDSEELEFSVHPYTGGQPQNMTVVPRIIVSMKQEKDIWKLSEITVAIHVPLSDPDYLDGLEKVQNAASQSGAASTLRMLTTTEVTYTAVYPERGFACNLSVLGGFDNQEGPSADHAMLIDDALASGNRDGYVFSIKGCDARPASRYRVTAVPADPGLGMRAFWSDESGVLRYSVDGQASTCLKEGIPLDK